MTSSPFSIQEIEELGLPHDDEIDALVEVCCERLGTFMATDKVDDYVAPEGAPCSCNYCAWNYGGWSGINTACTEPIP